MVETPLVTAKRLELSEVHHRAFELNRQQRCLASYLFFCTYEIPQLCFYFTSVEVLPSEGWIPHSRIQALAAWSGWIGNARSQLSAGVKGHHFGKQDF